MNVTDKELSLLILWLFEGGNFYNNPNHLIGENGQEMFNISISDHIDSISHQTQSATSNSPVKLER